ncbi:MAG: hypothetical protein EB099_04400, partial [Actinobacteria bacterium]|nr:hypothetical protein [Actinomycetota bacterium]
MKLHPYRHSAAAIATKHLKEQIIAPRFAQLEIALQVAPVDTDLLGTFTGEIERVGTPKEVALRKARLGMQATGLPYGIASEGSIGPDPMVPFLYSDIECLAWVDDLLGIEIVEFHRSMEIVAAHAVIDSGFDLEGFLKKADFPNHGLIVKSKAGITKGITNPVDLEKALTNDAISIESDLRSQFSPSRQKNIAVVAQQLVGRLAVLCKQCQNPGFGVVGNLYGLECVECKNFMEKAVRGKRLGCFKCDYREEIENEKMFVQPADCDY